LKAAFVDASGLKKVGMRRERKRIPAGFHKKSIFDFEDTRMTSKTAFPHGSIKQLNWRTGFGVGNPKRGVFVRSVRRDFSGNAFETETSCDFVFYSSKEGRWY
jgi:hypothetical protein